MLPAGFRGSAAAAESEPPPTTSLRRERAPHLRARPWVPRTRGQPRRRPGRPQHRIDRESRAPYLVAAGTRQAAGRSAGTFAAAEQRASGYFRWNSVWLRNSIRGAAALGIAVLLADVTGVQHSFWVVLGTLSVLRSNALNTGQTALRGVLGTSLGVIVGAALLLTSVRTRSRSGSSCRSRYLWQAWRPAAISFAAGQAAFTDHAGAAFQHHRADRMERRPAPHRGHRDRLRRQPPRRRALLATRRVRRAPPGTGRRVREGVHYLAAAVTYGLDQCDPAAADRSAHPGTRVAPRGRSLPPARRHLSHLSRRTRDRSASRSHK